QLAADTMKALKESKKTSRRQLGTGASSEGTVVSSGVLDESKVIPTPSSEGTVIWSCEDFIGSFTIPYVVYLVVVV
ncbi:hypothetical protein Tco_0607290, partial [Tanacetum coccineum]